MVWEKAKGEKKRKEEKKGLKKTEDLLAGLGKDIRTLEVFIGRLFNYGIV